MIRAIRRSRQGALLMALATPACDGHRPSTALSPIDRDAVPVVTVSQIPSARTRTGVAQVAAASAPAAIGQVATDRQADEDAAPEVDLTREQATVAPDMALYREVALAWQAIRARGQQPSPELLAQAVGPDNLATFLSTFRNADRMFRPDVDAWPVAPIGANPSRPSGDGP